MKFKTESFIVETFFCGEKEAVCCTPKGNDTIFLIYRPDLVQYIIRGHELGTLTDKILKERNIKEICGTN